MFVVPSPQSIEHVSVSSVPGSTIVASAVTGEPSGYGPPGDSVSVGVGLTLFTVRVSLPNTGGLMPSLARNNSVYVPLSKHVTVVDGELGSAKVQGPVLIAQVVVPSPAVAVIGNAVPSSVVPALPEPSPTVTVGGALIVTSTQSDVVPVPPPSLPVAVAQCDADPAQARSASWSTRPSSGRSPGPPERWSPQPARRRRPRP